VHVGLFIPCYVDQLKPDVGLATVELLEEQGVAFDYPVEQTCCGQAFLTAGATREARRLARRFVDVFERFDCVVTPSGSCAATMRRHLPHLVGGSVAERVAGSTYELCEFLVDVVGVSGVGGSLDARVGLHASCHALRDLRSGTASELCEPIRDAPARRLLESISGIELVELERPDECCGFGGVFAVEEPDVSVRMGIDRVCDHQAAGAEIVTSTDTSCLMQLDGVASRRGSPLRFVHIAELLAQRTRS
jgi:L-lactate dehydrogenase complex protein LldE